MAHAKAGDSEQVGGVAEFSDSWRWHFDCATWHFLAFRSRVILVGAVKSDLPSSCWSFSMASAWKVHGAFTCCFDIALSNMFPHQQSLPQTQDGDELQIRHLREDGLSMRRIETRTEWILCASRPLGRCVICMRAVWLSERMRTWLLSLGGFYLFVIERVSGSSTEPQRFLVIYFVFGCFPVSFS